MKLQILIPQYSETEDIIKPLLDSIALQQRINFEDVGVVIVNDGSDVFLTRRFLDSYPFLIEYYTAKHSGVSATRNRALDYAAAEYVMVCDADDMFYSVCGLWVIFQEIEKGGFDSLVSTFVEETKVPDSGEFVFITHDMDQTFVHGKVHRRQYLIDKGIRFNEGLKVHEDSYFNILCQNLSDNVKYCSTPFYLWKWRDESVCRHDPKYILKTYRKMIDSIGALISEFERRGVTDKAILYVCYMVYDAYYTMNKPEWVNQANADYRRETELRFRDWFRSRKETWETALPQAKMEISNIIRGRNVKEGMMMESITITEWLEKVEAMQ